MNAPQAPPPVAPADAAAGSAPEPGEEQAFEERLIDLAPIAWVTWTLVLANTLVWAVTMAKGANMDYAPAELLLAWGGNATSEAQRGEWWRLATAAFLHSGFAHLLMNMVGLVSIGTTVERIYGHRLFALIYLGSALMGNGLSLSFSAQEAVAVGASGAVFGVAGALAVAVLQHRDTLPRAFSKTTLASMGFFVGYSLFQVVVQPNIDNAAHIGGLLGGAMLAALLPERFEPDRFQRLLARRAAAALAAVAFAALGLAAIAPKAKVDKAAQLASELALTRALRGYDAAIQALQADHRGVSNRTLTQLQSDERARTVHVPAFREVRRQIDATALPPDDARRRLLAEARSVCVIMEEALALPTVALDDGRSTQHVDRERARQLERELRDAYARVEQAITDLNQKKTEPKEAHAPSPPAPGL